MTMIMVEGGGNGGGGGSNITSNKERLRQNEVNHFVKHPIKKIIGFFLSNGNRIYIRIHCEEISCKYSIYSCSLGNQECSQLLHQSVCVRVAHVYWSLCVCVWGRFSVCPLLLFPKAPEHSKELWARCYGAQSSKAPKGAVCTACR